MREITKMYIQQIRIYGSFRPQLVLKGWVYSDNYKIIISTNKRILKTFKGNVNNEEVARYFKDSKLKNKYGYDYEERISFFDKKINVKIVDKDDVIYEKNVDNRFLYKISLKLRRIIRVLLRGLRFLWKEYHFLVPPKMLKMYYVDMKSKLRNVNIDFNFIQPMDKIQYREWIIGNEIYQYDSKLEKFEYNPLISILVPVYNVDSKYLSECIDSVINQNYPNWELCIADDCSTNKDTLDCLKKYEKKDKRIKVTYREKNGHISEATNTALEMANGEFVALLDNDDLLSEYALYENVKVLNKHKDLDMIYSDEDKLDLDGQRCDPHFKSDFAPDTLMSSNYICHFTLLRKSIMEKIGGERKGYEGAQDYDLFLRFTEETNKIYHIPKILYHWRMIPGSTSMDTNNKNYAYLRGKLALEDALKRRKIDGEVITYDDIPYYTIDYKYKKEPSISIIIPTRDYADILEVCLNSLYEKTNYKNYEVIVVDNGSKEQKTFDLFDKYKKHDNFKILTENCEFNYSYLNNQAVKIAKGDYIVLLNNDTEIIDGEWLRKMVSYAMQEHIGTVGIKLLYPDNTVQHGGVILGLGGIGRHLFLNSSRNSIGLYGRLRVPYNYGCVTAACLMIKKSKFNEIGGLEEKLKVAFNDVDLNIKSLKKGYYNVFLPQVEMYHHESKSRGLDTTVEKQKRLKFEIDYMQKKWKNILNRDPFYNINFSLIKEYMLERSYDVIRKGEITDEEE